MRHDWIHPEHLSAWTALTNKLAVVDDTEEFYEEEDLAEELAEPGVQPELDTLGLWIDGAMVGYGQLRLSEHLRDGRGRVFIGGGVAPDYRKRGLGTVIMDDLEARAVEKMREVHPGVDFTIDMWGNTPGHSASAFAASRGYEPTRHFQDMAVTPPEFRRQDRTHEPSTNLRLAHYSADLAELVRELDNEAFADHWGSTPKSVAEWDAMTRARSFRNEYSRILLEVGDDPVQERGLCYVLSGEWVPKELYISRVGTARSARGRGYAAWALSTVVEAAFAGGYVKVDLSVDTESPTGAVGLYERLGFAVVRRGTMFRKSCLAG
ncbi:MAG: GNAT family N-acetyltransferase [Paeniglutamicibacter terrestris]|jgi:mycothiol synthase